MAIYFTNYNLLFLYILPVTSYSGYIFYQLQLTLLVYFASNSLLWLYILPITTYSSCIFASNSLLWLYIFPFTTYTGYIFCQLQLPLARYFPKCLLCVLLSYFVPSQLLYLFVFTQTLLSVLGVLDP